MEKWNPFPAENKPRLVAVAEEEAREILKQIFLYQDNTASQAPLGLNHVILVPPEELPAEKNSYSCFLLVPSLEHMDISLPRFRYVAVEYEQVQAVNYADSQLITYSQHSPGADLFVRNLRSCETGIVMELVWNGVIGRITLSREEQIPSALMAALAAVRCGVSFARVADALNSIHQPLRQLYG